MLFVDQELGNRDEKRYPQVIGHPGDLFLASAIVSSPGHAESCQASLIPITPPFAFVFYGFGLLP
jgi:hypothetical protein